MTTREEAQSSVLDPLAVLPQRPGLATREPVGDGHRGEAPSASDPD